MIKYFLSIGLLLSSLPTCAEGVARLVVSHAQFGQISQALSSMCGGLNNKKSYVGNGGVVQRIDINAGNSELINAAGQVAVWCSGNFSNTWLNVISFSLGGDFGAVGLSVGNQRTKYIDIDTRTGELKGTSSALADGGFVDFDLPAFDFGVLEDYGLSVYPSSSYVSYATVYGVAVSGKLYVDLQKAQGLSGCGVNDVSLSCQPSISKAVYASIISSAFNTAKQDVNATLGVGAKGDKLTLCRFNKYHGSERAVNEYFLRAASGSDGHFSGAIDSADSETYASIKSGLSTFDLTEVDDIQSFDSCVKGRGGYAIGVMPMRRYPTIVSGSGEVDNVWRYVKLNNVEIFDRLGSSTKAALEGRYDFWFYGSKFSASPIGESVINAIDGTLASRPLGVGVFGSGQAFDRASNFHPVLRN